MDDSQTAVRQLVENIENIPDGVAPNAKFLLNENKQTHKEIRNRIGLARGLYRNLGLKQCDRAVIVSNDDNAIAILYGATLSFGVCAAILDPAATAAELNVLIEKIAPTVIFMDEDIVARIQIGAQLPDSLIQIAATKPVRTKIGLLLRKKKGPPDEKKFPHALDKVSPAAAIVPDPRDPALLLFTSGTTSKPKGVELSFGNLAAQARTLTRQYQIDQESVVVNHLPFHHSDGLNQSVLTCLFAGAGLYREGRVTMHNLGSMLDNIYRIRATHLVTVPVMLGMIQRLPNDYDDSFSSPEFRMICSTAGYLDAETWKRVEERFRVVIVNSYGLTETTIEALYCGPDSTTRKVGTIGKPVDCVARLRDTDNPDSLDSDRGELMISGSNVMKGYFRNPEATAKVLRDGWLATGDLAERDEDGHFRIVGRLRNMILRGGVNVYPEDVEAALATAQNVTAANVIGVKDETGDERVIACVITDDPLDFNPETKLFKYCRETLAKEKVPDRILRFESLPHGPSGKVDQNRLRQLAESAMSNGSSSASSVRERVIEVAAKTFGLAKEDISVDLALDDSGDVDSLRYLEFVMSLERNFNVRFSPRETMTMSSVAAAVGMVESHIGSDGKPK